MSSKDKFGDVLEKVASKSLRKSKNTHSEKGIEEILDLLKTLLDTDDPDEKKRILKDFGMESKELAAILGKELAYDGAKRIVDRKIKKSDREIIQTLQKDGFADILLDAVSAVAPLIKGYTEGTVERQELAGGLMDVCYTQLAPALVKSGVLDKKNVGKAIQTVVKKPKARVRRPRVRPSAIAARVVSPAVKKYALITALAIVAYIALMEAYKYYKASAENNDLNQEEKAQVEKVISSIIESIQKYKKQIDENIASYFSYRYDEIKSAFEALNHTILENDVKEDEQLQEVSEDNPQKAEEEGN